VIKYTHRGLGRDKLPATAPVLPLFGGRLSVYVLVDGLSTIQEEANSPNNTKTVEQQNRKTLLLVFRCSQIKATVQTLLR
jgi:hypothetical protein